ncbi:MAG: hypothetical protein VX642_07845 [Bdellovibrionota bacterium]|nr:hypothetical protein [Bdellovibrionota bacterium]
MSKQKPVNRAKSSGFGDFLGLFAIVIGMILLVYLMIENYMGYTGVQKIIKKEPKKIMKIQDK